MNQQQTNAPVVPAGQYGINEYDQIVRRSPRIHADLQRVRDEVRRNLIINAQDNPFNNIDPQAMEVYRDPTTLELIDNNWTSRGRQYDPANDNDIQELSRLYINKQEQGTLYATRFSDSKQKFENAQMLTRALSRLNGGNDNITFEKIHIRNTRSIPNTFRLCDELHNPASSSVLVILGLSPFHATLLFIVFPEQGGNPRFYSVGFGYGDENGDGPDKIPIRGNKKSMFGKLNDAFRCKVGSIYSPDYLTPEPDEKFKPVWVGKYTVEMRDKLQQQLATVTSVTKNTYGNPMLNVTTTYSEAGASLLGSLPESASWCANTLGYNTEVKNCLMWAQSIIGQHNICRWGNPAWDCGGDITNEDWNNFITNINDDSIRTLNEKLMRRSGSGGRNKRKQRKTHKKNKKTKRKKRKNKKTKKMY